MIARLLDFFKPPEFDNFEQTQKARFLHYSLMVAIITCILIGLQNMTGGSGLDIFLYIVAGMCLLGIPANKRGYYALVAWFISIVMLALVTYSLIAGIGLRDAGLAAYPIFIIFASYLFNKRAVIYTVLLSILSILLVFFLDQAGLLHPPTFEIHTQLIVLIVLFATAGVLLWAVTDNWEKTMGNVHETYDMTLSGWGQALEYRDHETQGHSQRVVELTVALAKAMGVPPGHLEHIRRGALLHDIGKMAVPDAILLKTDPLTEEDWKIIRKHPIYARKMLENIPYLKQAIEIPYSHHEHWDGSGYPLGLAKKDIPLAARIFSVVDVWDALTSERPYRPAWTEDKASDYILSQSGKYFDPQIVEVFLEYIRYSQKTPASA